MRPAPQQSDRSPDDDRRPRSLRYGEVNRGGRGSRGDRWDTGRGPGDIVEMPLLAEAIARHQGVLNGVSVLYINHAISDALMVARGLRAVGADLVNVLVPYRGARITTRQTRMRRAFRELGPTYCPEPRHPVQFADAMRADVAVAITDIAREAEHRMQPWMIVEDGGYAFPALHDVPDLAPHLASCLGAVEHTSRGRWNYEYLETDAPPRTPRKLARPAVTISGSRLKTAHEGAFIAQALLDECHWLLRRDHQFLRNRTVLVTGYGRVGRVLARALHQADATVLVHDPDATDLDPGIRTSDPVSAIAAGAFLLTPLGVDGLDEELARADALAAYDPQERKVLLAQARTPPHTSPSGPAGPYPRGSCRADRRSSAHPAVRARRTIRGTLTSGNAPA